MARLILAHGFDPQPARPSGKHLRESIGPFDNHDSALVKIFVEPDLVDFRLLLEPEKIKMKHGQPALSIFVKEGEGRARHFVACSPGPGAVL